MKPISILALQQIPVKPKNVKDILSLSDLSDPTCHYDLIKILETANAKFGGINIPDSQAAKVAWDKAHEILKRSEQQNIQIISQESSYYPECLSLIANPPVLLHVKGNIKALNKNSIAIVGTRNPSDHGKNRAKEIAGLFAKEGYVVVSGLAQGVDSAAHMGALEAKGITVAVLAHGLDIIYPYANKPLSNDIIKNNGALISEYSLGTRIERRYFVERDRIQSGMSLGVFVIETGIKGGTMHTVDSCKKQNRVLIVMKHPQNLLDAAKQCGNTQLINDKKADIVFETDDNLVLAKDIMQKKKDELLMLKSPQQISILEKFEPLKIQPSELMIAEPSQNQYNSVPEKPTEKELKDITSGFVTANKLISFSFRWDEVIGNDSERLKDFLKQKFSIDWIQKAIIENIEKIEKGNNIRIKRISIEKNSILLELTPKGKQLKIEIDGVRIGKWKVETIDGLLKISDFKPSQEKKIEIKNDAKSQTTIGDFK